MSAMLVGPTGARTDINISPNSAIFLGDIHQVVAVGLTLPKSDLPRNFLQRVFFYKWA